MELVSCTCVLHIFILQLMIQWIFSVCNTVIPLVFRPPISELCYCLYPTTLTSLPPTPTWLASMATDSNSPLPTLLTFCTRHYLSHPFCNLCSIMAWGTISDTKKNCILVLQAANLAVKHIRWRATTYRNPSLTNVRVYVGDQSAVELRYWTS